MTDDCLPFDLEPPPREPRRPEQLVRPSDPETSYEAAQAAVEQLRVLQERVLNIFRADGPMCQHALIAAYRERYGEVVPESTVRTRCAELVAAGLVMDSGERVVLPSHRRAVVWRAVRGDR